MVSLRHGRPAIVTIGWSKTDAAVPFRAGATVLSHLQASNGTGASLSRRARLRRADVRMQHVSARRKSIVSDRSAEDRRVRLARGRIEAAELATHLDDDTFVGSQQSRPIGLMRFAIQ